MFTAFCCAAPAWCNDSDQPGEFETPRNSRPLQVAVEDADQGSSARATPGEVKRASNSRVIARKAVHITFIDDPEEKGGPAVLRWRTSIDSASRAEIVDEEVSPAQATLEESGPYLAAPAVLESADDFSDPFDDRLRVYQPEGTAESADPAAQENAPAESEANEQEQEAAPQQLEPQGESRQLEVPQEEPGLRPSVTEFNNRDCASEIQDCENVRRRIKGRPIRNISLDISPVFNPAADQSASPPPERSREFENMKREWRNNDGELIATGAMAGIENGRVLIRNESGEIQRIEYRELSDEDLCYFAAWWGIPTECTLGVEEYAGRSFTPSTFTWKASALCHKPLYFEEVQLERYGHTTGPIFQPVVSGAHFFLNIATLPYNMGIHPPTECQYALGYYRPGDCAPWLLPPIPLSLRGGLAQAGAVVGGIYILP